MRTRTAAIGCALVLLASACGSNLSDEQLAAGAGTGGGGPAATTPGGTAPGESPAEPTGPMFGTMEAPCGEAPEGFTPTASDQGITEEAIKIGVVSDKSGVVKVPTASIQESVVAFVEWCNGLGGINGRPLEILTFDTALFNVHAAVQQACDAGVFALVGSGQVFDDQGAKTSLDCGLPDVSAYSATAEKSLAPNVHTPIPNPPENNMVGTALYMAEHYPEAVDQAAIVSSDDVATAWIQALRVKHSWENAGIEFIVAPNTGVVEETYSPVAKQMKDAGVRFVTMVSETGEGLKLLRDMEAQGFEPDAVAFGAQYYDPVLLSEPYSEDTYVELNTIPFEEAEQVPAMQQFLDAYEAVGSNIQPTSLGVQAFSAALLFAAAARNAGAELTHETLEAELGKISAWDGGGLHYETNPASRTREGCFILMQIKDGAFQRVFPEEPGTFSCDPENLVEVTDPDLNGSKVNW